MNFAYDTREVTHGTEFGAFAPIVKNASGQLETSTKPTEFTGLRGVSFETSQDSNPYYADNVEHVRLSGAKSTEGSIKAYQMPKAFLTAHLGYKLSSNGGLTDTGTPSNFIWQFIETITDEFGETFRQLTVYYNVNGSAPMAEATTNEDSASPKEFEIPCTASPNNLVLDADSNPVTMFQIRETAENKALIDLAYDQVILPNTPVPTPEG